jgi:hypothetical protein
MSQAALLRRLRSAQAGSFCPPTRGSFITNPREAVEIEQDYSRLQLAAELLKIAAEASSPDKLPEIAAFAIAAAAKVYPEVPAENDPLPEPSREGAQYVLARQE